MNIAYFNFWFIPHLRLLYILNPSQYACFPHIFLFIYFFAIGQVKGLICVVPNPVLTYKSTRNPWNILLIPRLTKLLDESLLIQLNFFASMFYTPYLITEKTFLSCLACLTTNSFSDGFTIRFYWKFFSTLMHSLISFFYESAQIVYSILLCFLVLHYLTCKIKDCFYLSQLATSTHRLYLQP